MNINITKFVIKISIIFIMLSSCAYAAANDIAQQGKDYTVLPADLRNNPDIAQLLIKDPNKTQLLYFFSYGCPACARFTPEFDQWAAAHKNKHVVIYKFPVAFKQTWVNLAKLYYVMKALDPKETLNVKIFNAIHNDDLPLWEIPVMQKFFVDNGYNVNDFDKAINSFNVDLEVDNAEHISKAYSINQTPAIIINGLHNSYKLAPDTQDSDNFLKVVDYVLLEALKK